MNMPENYPYGSDEKEISSALRGYADEIIASGGDVNTVLQLAPLIVIGHTELQSRQTNRVTRISVGLGILSLVIALVALWVSIANNRTETHWQTTQLELLNRIEADLKTRDDLQTTQFDLLKNIDRNVHKISNEGSPTVQSKK
jgi:hypothetical protein